MFPFLALLLGAYWLYKRHEKTPAQAVKQAVAAPVPAPAPAPAPAPEPSAPQDSGGSGGSGGYTDSGGYTPPEAPMPQPQPTSPQPQTQPVKLETPRQVVLKNPEAVQSITSRMKTSPTVGIPSDLIQQTAPATAPSLSPTSPTSKFKI